MTAPRDPDRLIHAFLQEGAEQLHDQVYDAVRAQVERKRQRAVIGPWRTPDMSKFLAIGLAAAVVVALVAGTQLLGRPAPGGVGAAPSATPVPTVALTPNPSPAATEPVSDLPSAGPIEAGTYRVPDSSLLITVPSGWDIADWSIRKHRDQPGELALTFHGPEIEVYPDACANDVTPPTAGPTTDDLLAALRAQENSEISEPTEFTAGEVAATRVEFSPPEGLDLATCFDQILKIWHAPGTGYNAFGYQPTGTYPPKPAYFADTPSGRVVFEFDHQPDASDADIAELEAIVGSMAIESAP